MCKIVMVVYTVPTVCHIVVLRIKTNCGWPICCINGEPIVVIARRQCLTSKHIAAGPRKSCFGSCWRQPICRKRPGANWAKPKTIHRYTSTTTRRVFCFCRNSSSKLKAKKTRTTSQWTIRILIRRNFHQCTIFRWRNMDSVTNHFKIDRTICWWTSLQLKIATRCKRRKRPSLIQQFNGMSKHTRIYEIFFDN